VEAALTLLVLLEQRQHERDERGAEQNFNEHIVELFQDELPQGLALFGRQLCAVAESKWELALAKHNSETNKKS
jgi:hypothetical protein